MAAGPGGASHDAFLLFDWQRWLEGGREPGTCQAELLRDVALHLGWLIIFSKSEDGKK